MRFHDSVALSHHLQKANKRLCNWRTQHSHVSASIGRLVPKMLTNAHSTTHCKLIHQLMESGQHRLPEASTLLGILVHRPMHSNANAASIPDSYISPCPSPFWSYPR